MNSRANAYSSRLCGSVDPSVQQQPVHTETVMGLAFKLRLAYIANDDLTFINQCTQQWDEYAAGMHREPYYSVALSDSGQTFIILLNDDPVCVIEVHHALQYYVGEEFMPKENDYLVRLFFGALTESLVQQGVIQFFTNYCNKFSEVGGLIIKADSTSENVLAQAGYSPYKNAAGGASGYYYYSTSKENV
jgi:hypothetical protein